MRALLHILSALLILVTAQGFAASRLAEAPTGRAVLCVGNAVVVVLTDADGQPVEVPHVCPEATLLAAVESSLELPLQPERVMLLNASVAVAAAPLSGAVEASARAPPAFV